MSDGGASLGVARAEIQISAKQAIATLKQFGDAADQTMRSVGQSGTTAASGFASFEKTLSSSNVQAAGGVLAGIGAAVGLIGGFAINSAMQFDQGMANVRAATGATGQEFDSLRNLALQIGKDTSFSANEATLAIEELAKAGVSTTDILGGAAEATTALAAAGGVALPEAATVMAASMNQFGLAAGDASGYYDEFGNSVNNASHIADVLAGAALASSTGVSEMGASLSYVGTSAAALGVPIEDTTTALALMAKQNIIGSAAGTSLNQVLLSLANPTAQAAGVMQELGLSFTDMNGNMLPLPDIISQVSTATEGMGNATRQAYLETLFGVEGGKAMNALLISQDEALAGTTGSWDGMYAAVTDVGVAQEQAQARLNSTSGRLDAMKGSLETVGIVIGSKLLPAFDAIILGATSLLNAFLELPSGAQAVIAAVVGIAGAVAGVAGAFILVGPKVIDAVRGFKDLAGIGKSAATGIEAVGSSAGKSAAGMNTANTAGKGLRATMLGILGPVALVAAAAFLIYEAYQHNFLGFADMVNSAGSKIKDVFTGIKDAVVGFVDGFKDKIDQLMGPMKGAIEITDVFGNKISVIGNVGPGLGRLAATFQALADTIRGIGGGDSGFFNGIADGIEWVGSAVQGVIGFFQTWQSAWERLTAPIKEARTATDAFGKTVTVMVNTGERMNGLVAIFLSLAEAIRGIGDGKIGWLNDIAAGFEEVGAIVGHFIKQIQPAIAILKAGFGEGFVAGLASIDVAFKVMAAAAGDALDSLGDLGQRAFARLGKAVGTLAEKFPALKNTFTALAQVITNGGEIMADIFHLVADILRGDFSGALDSLKSLAGNVLDGIGNGFELLVSIVTDVAGMLQSLLGNAFDALSSRFDTFSSTFDMLGGVITNIIGVVRNLGEALIAAFHGDWSGVWENLQDAFTDAVQAILSLALTVPTFLLELFTGMSWSEIGSAIKDAFNDAWDAVRSGASALWDGISSGASGLANGIRSALSSISTGVFDWLNNTSASITNGLNAAWDAITSLTWDDFIPDVAWDVFIGAINLATKVGDFLWDTFVTAVDLAAKVGDFIWSKFVTAVNLAQKVGDFLWSSFVTAVDLTVKVGAFLWSAFVTAVDLAAKVGDFIWSTFVTAVDLATKVGSFLWSAFVTSVDLTAKVGTFLWSSFITAVNLAVLVGSFAWSTFVTGVSLIGLVSTLVWSNFISGTVDVSTKIASFAWSAVITGTVAVGDFIASLDWSGFISGAVDVADYIASWSWKTLITGIVAVGDYISSLDWGSFISGAVDVATYIAKLAWSSFISGAINLIDYVTSINWGDFVPDLTWPAIPTFSWPAVSDIVGSIPWPDIPSFSWPSKDEILGALTGGLIGGGDGQPVDTSLNPAPGPAPTVDPNFIGPVIAPPVPGTSSVMRPNIEGGGTIAPPKVLPPDFGPATSAATAGLAGILSEIAAFVTSVQAAATSVRTAISSMRTGVVADVTATVTTTSALFTGWAASIGVAATGIGLAVRLPISTMKIGVVTDITDMVTTTLVLMSSWAMQLGVAATALDLAIRLPISTMKIGVVADLTDMVTTTLVLVSSWAMQLGVAAMAVDLAVRLPISTMKIGVVADVTDLATSTIALMGAWAAALPAIATGVSAGVRAAVSTMKIGAVADVRDLVSSSIAQFGAMSAGLTAIAASVSASVRSNISTMKIGAVADVRDLVNTAIAQFGAMSSGLTSIASTIRGSVVSSMSAMASGAGGAAQGMAGSVIGAMQSMSAGAIGAAANMVGTVVGIVAGGAGAGSSAGFGLGSAIGQGVASGMNSALGAVQAAANAIVATATRAMAAAAQIRSPSKVFRDEVGIPIGQGVAVGIASQAWSIAGAARSVVQGAIEAAKAMDLNAIMGGDSVKNASNLVKSYLGDNTPKGLEDIALALDKLAGASLSSDATRKAIADLDLRLKAYKGDNTPQVIVDAARMLDRLLGKTITGIDGLSSGWKGAWDEAPVFRPSPLPVVSPLPARAPTGSGMSGGITINMGGFQITSSGTAAQTADAWSNAFESELPALTNAIRRNLGGA